MLTQGEVAKIYVDLKKGADKNGELMPDAPPGVGQLVHDLCGTAFSLYDKIDDLEAEIEMVLKRRIKELQTLVDNLEVQPTMHEEVADSP